MFDRRSASDKFRLAVRNLASQRRSSGSSSGDPIHVLASIFRISLTTTSIDDNNNHNNKANSESFQADNGTDWSNILNPWLDVCEAAEKGHAVQCYDSQVLLHGAFNQLFSASMGNTLVPVLIEICKSTHRLAVLADYEIASRDHAKLNNAALLLQESYSKSYSDRKELQQDAPYDSDGSKKVAVLFIVNELFRIYFRLNTLRLCKNVMKPTEAKQLHVNGATMGQMITYKYFSGRLNLYEDNFSMAEQNLEYAFNNCPVNATHNKRCILRYLIPIKLYRGKLPTAQLLQDYNLVEFVNVIDSIRKGDLRLFNTTLLEYQHLFIRQGTYLLLERCKSVCYRSLFKRIYHILNKPFISLDVVLNAFEFLNMSVDMDEVECIIANLIYRGIIRGYIAHTKRILVLSKSNAFPIESLGR